MSMRGLRNVLNHFRFIKGNNALVVTFFGLGLLSFGVLGLTQFTSAQAADCSPNAVMKCGANTAQEFKNKCTANAEGDLRAIYGHYRIPCDIQVVEGLSYKDNTVRVNGRVVATNAQSVGRVQKPGDHAISIAGKTYWEAPNSVAFRSDALPTFVALDAQGNFKYAIIKDCGNPVYATPVPPTPQPPKPQPPVPQPPKPQPPKPQAQYRCDALNVMNKGNNTYEFTIVETHTNATYKGATIDFGDGDRTQITGTTATHQYQKPGNYTITATLSFDVDGQVRSVKCQAKVTMEVCPYNSSLPKDSPDCKEPVTPVTTTPQPPAELPKTGIDNMLLSGFGAGSMIIAASLYIGSRRDLLATLLG